LARRTSTSPSRRGNDGPDASGTGRFKRNYKKREREVKLGFVCRTLTATVEERKEEKKNKVKMPGDERKPCRP